ncbi:uncharacterized protein [Watersipora subatra]
MLYANLDPYQNCQKIHLITMYFRMLSQERYQNFSAFQASNRNKEYLEVLQSNLNHPCVQRIHLFYVKEEDLEALKVANLTSMEKLHPVKQERLIQMSDFFIYASRHLLKKLVIALNGDIVLGEGVQLINVEKMLDGKLLYSLTRYEGHLKCSEKRHMCLDNYEGSHDTHIFALREPLNETVILDKLSYPINMHQAENDLDSCKDCTVDIDKCESSNNSLRVAFSAEETKESVLKQKQSLTSERHSFSCSPLLNIFDTIYICYIMMVMAFMVWLLPQILTNQNDSTLLVVFCLQATNIFVILFTTCIVKRRYLKRYFFRIFSIVSYLLLLVVAMHSPIRR